jgi:putative peptidoglycan lipid II flippase
MKHENFLQSAPVAFGKHLKLVACGIYLKKGIQKATSLLAVLQILVVGLTFLKEVALTAFFGLTHFMDAYTLINNVLIFTRSYFEQLGYGALIPTQGELSLGKESQNASLVPLESAQHDFLNVVFNYTLLFTFIVSSFIFLQHDWVAWLIAPTWSDEKLNYLALLTWIVLPSCLLFQMAEMLRVLSVQQERFILYQLPRVISLILFIGGFVSLFPVIGILALLIALPVSQLVELIAYCFFLNIRPKWIWYSPSLKPFLEKLLPVSLTWVIFSLSILVDNFFLSFLPTGEPSAFRYAYVSVVIAGSLTVVNLQLAKLSEVNNACQKKDISQVKSLFKDASIQIVLWSLPLVVGSIILAPWLIQIIYVRGAFTSHNALLVSQCYQILVVLIPYTALWRLISNCYYNLNLIRPLFLIGLIVLVLRVGMEWIGLKLWGLQGISWMVMGNSYLILLCLGFYLIRLKLEPFAKVERH